MQPRIERFQLYGDGLDTYSPDLLHIETIASRAPLHNWFIAPHRHPGIVQLLLLEAGSGLLLAEGEEQPLPSPALVLIPCDCPHAFRFAENADGWVLSVSDVLVLDTRVSFADKTRFMARNAVNVLPLDAREGRTDLIMHLLRDIARRQVDARIEVDAAVTAALSLLLALAEELAGLPVDGIVAPDPRVQTFRNFMALVETRYRSNCRVDQFASALGCSEATLTRACRAVTGKAPGQLVGERRMLEARRSLSYTSASVRQVAEELGFTDVAYFARMFRRHAGMTATAYRRRNTLPVSGGATA